MLPNTDMQYFGDDGDRMHMMFNFQVNQNLFFALASADTKPLVKAMENGSDRQVHSGAFSCAIMMNLTSVG